MSQKKTATLNLRVDSALKKAALKAAKADRRSLTSLIEKLLADYCRRNGLMK
jgi:predicted HicB family RNase H-like nuclease